MTDLEDKVNRGKIVFDNNNQERKSWSCLGQTCSRWLIVFVSPLGEIGVGAQSTLNTTFFTRPNYEEMLSYKTLTLSLQVSPWRNASNLLWRTVGSWFRACWLVSKCNVCSFWSFVHWFKTTGQYMNYQAFSNLQFRRLVEISFHNTHIDLRDTSGEKILFVSVGMTRLFFMFRKVSNIHS